jgi:hypothetical protein
LARQASIDTIQIANIYNVTAKRDKEWLSCLKKKGGLHEFTTTHITKQEIHYKKRTTKMNKKKKIKGNKILGAKHYD